MGEMFTRYHGRRSRWLVVAILFAGAIAGTTIMSPVLANLAGFGGVATATSQTRSVSCNAYAFQPVDSATGADYANAKRTRVGTGGSGFYSCDPGIPHRAVVTKVQFSIWDGSGSSEVKFCGLFRSGLTSSNVDTVQELASVPATGIAQAPGFARLTDSSIQNATIDTSAFVYWAQCNLPQAGQSLGIFGANVTFTISAANG
jgi:hypothetical protein